VPTATGRSQRRPAPARQAAKMRLPPRARSYAASTAPAPKISTGMYSGSTSSDSSTPPPRTPSVSAAPMAPMPGQRRRAEQQDTVRTQRFAGQVELDAQHRRQQHQRQAGDQPVRDHFAEHDQPSGCGARASCSSVPSRWSSANRRGSESMVASSAATHSTPGASLRSSSGSGPTPSGNRLTTMMKKNSAETMSAAGAWPAQVAAR
jgi:hypothetical protein